MGVKRMRSDEFETGHYAETEDREPIDKVTNRSEIRGANKMHSNAGRRGHDALMNALGTSGTKKSPPTDNHHFRHSAQSRPRGAHYNPMGQFGRTRPTGVGSTHQIYGGNRMSARPSNAVGSPPNRFGDNAIGNAPNRFGGNALASDFRPRFSKPHGNRV